MGCPNPDAMLAQMSAAQVMEWVLFQKLEKENLDRDRLTNTAKNGLTMGQHRR